MKNLSLLFIIALTVQTTAWAQKKDCARVATFGDIQYCIPKFDGFIECVDDESVKAYIELTEIESNTVLGYYLNEKDHEQRSQIGEFALGDYFKIYCVDQTVDLELSISDMEMLIPEVKSALLGENWKEIEEATEERFSDIDFGKPQLLKSYRLSNNSYTILANMKIAMEGSDDTYVALALNIAIVKKRLVFIAYYTDFMGKETIKHLETENNKVLTEFMRLNK